MSMAQALASPALSIDKSSDLSVNGKAGAGTSTWTASVGGIDPSKTYDGTVLFEYQPSGGATVIILWVFPSVNQSAPTFTASGTDYIVTATLRGHRVLIKAEVDLP